jgi:hypothetical protein
MSAKGGAPPAWATSWAISVLSDGSVQVAPDSVTLSLGVAAVCDLGQLKGSQLGATSEATALIRRARSRVVKALGELPRGADASAAFLAHLSAVAKVDASGDLAGRTVRLTACAVTREQLAERPLLAALLAHGDCVATTRAWGPGGSTPAAWDAVARELYNPPAAASAGEPSNKLEAVASAAAGEAGAPARKRKPDSAGARCRARHGSSAGGGGGSARCCRR